MSSKTKIGPLLACAISDSYGAGFEYVPPVVVRKHNDLSAYRQHPKWKDLTPGRYTDDCQMAMGLAEHLLMDNPSWNLLSLSERWVATFKRDQRSGYSGGFYKLLCEVTNGFELIAKLRPSSIKNGGAMRAFPLGFLEDTDTVRDLAMLQASLTHATYIGMSAAAGAALMFHYCYHSIGPLSDLPYFLDRMVPGVEFDKPWDKPVGSKGTIAVRAAMTALVKGTSLSDVLQRCVAVTGDVDTVAAIAMPAAAVCDTMDKSFSDHLIEGLENGTYGRDYIIGLDAKLVAKYPTAAEREAVLEAAREEKRETKRKAKAAKAKPEHDERGLLDFLYEDD